MVKTLEDIRGRLEHQEVLLTVGYPDADGVTDDFRLWEQNGMYFVGKDGEHDWVAPHTDLLEAVLDLLSRGLWYRNT